MKVFCVNIYIETSLRGPALREGAGEWIVEFIKEDGSAVTRNGILRREKTTENILVLELLKEALSILIKSCSIRVNTQCEHVLNTMKNHWISQWKKNNWRNAKGKPVKNMELWKQCSELMEKHFTEFNSGFHSYRLIMMNDIRKELMMKGQPQKKAEGRSYESSHKISRKQMENSRLDNQSFSASS